MKASDKYQNSIFVDLFIARQYGPFLISSSASLTRVIEGKQLWNSCEAYYQRLVATAREVVRANWTCIDLGCGPGRIAGELARLGGRTIGLDSSAAMIRAADLILRQPKSFELALNLQLEKTALSTFKLKGWGLNNLQLIQGSADLVPIENCTTDFVCCANVLSRLSQPDRALREFHRILRSGGYLLLSNDYDWSKQYTEAQNWFDDVRDRLQPERWSICSTEDDVTYTAWLHGRKVVTAVNQIVLAQRR